MTCRTRVTGVASSTRHSTRRDDSAESRPWSSIGWSPPAAGWKAGPSASPAGSSAGVTRSTTGRSRSTTALCRPGSSAMRCPRPQEAAPTGHRRSRPGSTTCRRHSCTTSGWAGGSISCRSHGGSRRTAFRQGLRALPLSRRLRALLDDARARRRGDVEAPTVNGPEAGLIVAVVPHGQDPPGAATTPSTPPGSRWSGTGSTPQAFAPAFAQRTGIKARGRLQLGPAPTFLFIAHNYYLKGLPVALRALARLTRAGEPAGVCVIGDSPRGTLSRRSPSGWGSPPVSG